MATNKILVIADEKDLVSLVENYLLQAGYRVLTANNGLEALSIVHSQKLDLIVFDLDIRTPNMDRYALIQQLGRSQKTPVVLLTARANDTEKIAALESGADDFLTKPFRPRELIARVGVILRRRG